MTPFKKPVSDFLEDYTNKKTCSNYKTAITHYLSMYSKQTVKSRDSHTPDILAKNYFREINRGFRDYKHDIKEFALQIDKKYAPTTSALYVRCIIRWLEDNGFRLEHREKTRIYACLPPTHPADINIELKRKIFRTLYFIFPDDLQVLLLVLLASGMRIGEALQLKRTDIKWNKEKTEIHIPANITKTKTARTTYLTDEAALILYEYLCSRSDTDERLFLITYTRAQNQMRTASQKLGYSKQVNGKIRGLHWHMTRKWFISRVSLTAGKDIAETLAGHEGYLSRSYRRYTKKQLIKKYKRAEKKLSILKEHEY